MKMPSTLPRGIWLTTAAKSCEAGSKKIFWVTSTPFWANAGT